MAARLLTAFHGSGCLPPTAMAFSLFSIAATAARVVRRRNWLDAGWRSRPSGSSRAAQFLTTNGRENTEACERGQRPCQEGHNEPSSQPACAGVEAKTVDVD